MSASLLTSVLCRGCLHHVDKALLGLALALNVVCCMLHSLLDQ